MSSLQRQSLPASFRITGSRSEAKAMLHIVENCLIKDIIEVGKSEDQQVEIKPFALPWLVHFVHYNVKFNYIFISTTLLLVSL